MPLEITFTLSDEDLGHFQDIVDKARVALDGHLSHAQIEVTARKLISETREADLPEFIAVRIAKLSVVIDMINDDEWQLSDEERCRVLSALAYFCDPEDLIPDHVPGLGFLDDAIYVEIVLRELNNEVTLYEEFCQFRNVEESRRAARGKDVKVGREEWLADKRAALHAKMRKRRRGGHGNGGWRMRLW
ncbi:MAG: YkvA family protein [Woeseiaceae bacterium]